MPVYDYQCSECRKVFANQVRSYEARVEGPECCGRVSSIVWLATPAVHGAVAFEPFLSPCDGKPIRTMAEYREDLKRNDCVPYEPGIKQDQERRKQREERETSQLVEKIVTEVAQRADGTL